MGNKNVACRIFKEQVNLINQLPEDERMKVLYCAIMQSFNQFDNQNDIQTENQNENAYVSVSESLSVLSKSVLELLSKNIVTKEFSNNYGGKRIGSGRPKTAKANKEDNVKDISAISFSFTTFWQAYPKKVDRRTAELVFSELTQKEINDVLSTVQSEEFSNWVKEQDVKFIQKPHNWLNAKAWLNDYSEYKNNTSQSIDDGIDYELLAKLKGDK